MVVCICNNINHKTIINHINDNGTFEDLVCKTGATTCCGCCKDLINNMFDESGMGCGNGVLIDSPTSSSSVTKRI